MGDGSIVLILNVFDLIVSDVEMPGMNGFDLARRVREDERSGDLPIVPVSSITEGTFDQESPVNNTAAALRRLAGTVKRGED